MLGSMTEMMRWVGSASVDSLPFQVFTTADADMCSSYLDIRGVSQKVSGKCTYTQFFLDLHVLFHEFVIF